MIKRSRETRRTTSFPQYNLHTGFPFGNPRRVYTRTEEIPYNFSRYILQAPSSMEASYFREELPLLLLSGECALDVLWMLDACSSGWCPFFWGLASFYRRERCLQYRFVALLGASLHGTTWKRLVSQYSPYYWSYCVIQYWPYNWWYCVIQYRPYNWWYCVE
jgi:hypothetical protein